LPAEAVERQGDLVLANRMKTKDKGGRPAHAPDDLSRQMVEVLSGFGTPQDKIADVIGVDGKTLRNAWLVIWRTAFRASCATTERSRMDQGKGDDARRHGGHGER
jgi:hypothetical protein